MLFSSRRLFLTSGPGTGAGMEMLTFLWREILHDLVNLIDKILIVLDFTGFYLEERGEVPA